MFSWHLETIGVLAWISVWSTAVIGPFLTTYVLLCTQYWRLAMMYIGWIYCDRHTPANGGRRWECPWRLPFRKWYANYFPLRLVKTAELEPNRNYLLACHPHGVLCCGMTGNLAWDGNNARAAFPRLKARPLTLHMHFYLPIFRDLLLLMGGSSVSRESMAALLRKPKGGNIVLVAPGGAREALYAIPGKNTLVLKHRKGFIKVAIQNGAPIIPAYSFGENDAYTQVSSQHGSWFRAYQEWSLKVFGVLPTRFNGRGIFQNYFGILPRRVPITTVVGSPIEVKQIDHPTLEYIDQIHGQYIQALIDLYNTYRQEYGDSRSDLVII